MYTIILQAQQATVPATHAAADQFVKMDPTGIGMTLISMTVVFVVLAIIFTLFKNLSNYMVKSAQKKVKNDSVEFASVKTDVSQLPAETAASIALALHMYNSSQHDMDSLMLTINKVSKMYSPWSSKIYTLRQLPR